MPTIGNISDATYRSKACVIRRYTKNGEQDALLELKKRSFIGFLALCSTVAAVSVYYSSRPDTASDAVLYIFFYAVWAYVIWACLGFKAVKRYFLSSDIALCHVENVYFEETLHKTSMTKSATRALLAGAAGSAWKHDKGFLSGMLASIAGSISPSSQESKVTEYTKVHICFVDGVFIEGVTTDNVAEALNDASLFNSQEEFERFKRMKQDSGRVLQEIDNKISSIKNMHTKLLDVSNNAPSFDERDLASKEAQRYEAMLEKENRFRRMIERNISDFQDESYRVGKLNKKYYFWLLAWMLFFISTFPLQ